MKYCLFVILSFLIACTGNNKPEENKGVSLELHLQETPTTASLRGLSVVTTSVVWASGSGGTVIRTVDGGTSWQDCSVPGADSLDFRDIEAFNENVAVILSAGLPARVYKTEDGGKSWVLRYENTTQGVFFDAMDFWDNQEGVAFSDPVDGKLLMIRTQDQGNTWEEFTETERPETKEGEAGFAASGTCLTVLPPGHIWIGTGGKASRVFHSVDKGKSWEVANTPMLQGEASTGIFSLAFWNDKEGLAVGGNYLQDTLQKANAMHTTDGGKTWSLLSLEGTTAGYRSGLALGKTGGQKVALAVGTSGMDYSLDQGNSWQNFSKEGQHAVAFAPEGGVAWTSGADGKVMQLLIKEKSEKKPAL
ncbi:hypothetical protein AAG747_08455 [Rapidithrix thailandica]|uniref:Oxidoreductase n=1 Tax=Rapidithrix thailandica TaxID=413964 RepID=A0AAW9RW91_9BACT